MKIIILTNMDFRTIVKRIFIKIRNRMLNYFFNCLEGTKIPKKFLKIKFLNHSKFLEK